MSARLVCVGNVVIDLTMTVPTLPVRGGEAVAQASRLTPGGAFNVMTAASRQGMPVVYAGTLGRGPFARQARRAMAQAGFAIPLGSTSAADTGWDLAVTDAGGERTFFTAVGAERELTRAQLDSVPLHADDIVYVSGYALLHRPCATELAAWLRQLRADVRVLVDPGPLVGRIEPDVLAAAVGRASWWTCNEREARELSGAGDAAEAAELLAVRFRTGILVRTGARGCLVRPAAGAVTAVAGFPVTVVDSNGAGDAHAGAFAAAWAGGDDPVAAARRANACAALAVTRPGPATAPGRDEVDALLRG